MPSFPKSTPKKKAAGRGKTSPPKLVIVRAEEWEALYVDGQLIDEGHTLDRKTILDATKADYEIVNANTDIEDDIQKRGGFPSKLSDVPGQS